ncbi:hypothetical protein ARMGADRAFT_1078985 [Armillaria gallica]|uniref:Uncharacterized protein n=1 Tax=Armillaria gallica TaxID=47427 RepID=A0A2H3DJN4_ARMGA|nr:hypothetical protein ARMGADRAFT_1078985 [Armillaria gallica]
MSTSDSSRNIPSSASPPHYHQYLGLVIIKDRHRVAVLRDIVLDRLCLCKFYDPPTLEEHIDQPLSLDAYRITNTLLRYEGVDIVIPACYFGQLTPFIETLELLQPVKVLGGRAFRGETPTATLCLAFVDEPPGSVCSEFADLAIHHPISSKLRHYNPHTLDNTTDFRSIGHRHPDTILKP